MFRSKDWKNQAHYPGDDKAKAMSLHLWAFLFLLRNRDFIAEMNSHVVITPPDEVAALDKAGAFDGKPRIDVDNRWLFSLDCNWWNTKGFVDTLKKYGTSNTIRHVELLGKGLADSFVGFVTYPVFARGVEVGKEEMVCLPLLDNLLVLGFDLSSPIVPQVDRAKRLLLERQEEFAGPKKTGARTPAKNFPMYLRVLDAMADNATNAEMLEVFSQEDDSIDEKTIRNWKKAAVALTNGGYLQLANGPDPLSS